MFEDNSIRCVVRGLASAQDLRSLPDSALVDAMTAAARVTAWSESVGLLALAELTTRRRTEHLDAESVEARASTVEEVDAFVASEVAAALRMSHPAARGRLVLAESLVARLPATLDALAEGRIDLQRARRVAEVTDVLSPEAAARVEARVLPRAPGQTPAQLGAACRRASHALDPAAATRRCAAALRGRRAVSTPLPDGMASLWVTGRAEVVAAAWLRIDALARAAHARAAHETPAPGDRASGQGAAPSLDELRADVALGMLAGSSDLLVEAAGVRVQLDVIAPLASILGVSDEPGHLEGYGPLPAPVVRALAGDARWRRFSTDGTGTVSAVHRHTYRPTAALADAIRARDATCRFSRLPKTGPGL